MDTNLIQELFEPELALLVGLQVVSSKEGGRKLFDKILLPGLKAYAGLGAVRDTLGSDQRGQAGGWG